MNQTVMPMEHATNRAELLLRSMHPVFSHDLPNQVVALQSLLQMLERCKVGAASVTEEDTLRRLSRVAEKINGMVGFLREMGRLNEYVQRVEEVRLAGLLREVRVELQQRAPDIELEYRTGGVASLSADPRLLTQAIVELLCLLIGPHAPGRAVLHLEAQAIGDGTELRGELTWPDAPVAGAVVSERPKHAMEKRLEWILARELLGASGGRLVEVRDDADGSRFSLLVPQRANHA